MAQLNGTKPAAVVTGASTGIGRASALMLTRLGWQVYAGVRSDEAAQDLQTAANGDPATGGRLTPIHLDVTDEAAIDAARNLVADEIAPDGLVGLVNNAGTTIPCPIEYLPLDEFRRQVEVNLTGHLAVTRAFLPLLRRPGARIANVSSPGAKIAAPFMAPYVAAKSGLEGLSGVMRVELAPAGIHVAVIEPGYVSTGMRHKLSRDTNTILSRLPTAAVERYGAALRTVMDRVVSEAADGAHPNVVAHAIAHALTAPRPRTRYPAGPGARRILLLARLVPDRVLDRVMARMLRLPAPFA